PGEALRYYNDVIKPEPGSFAAMTDFSATFYRPVVIDKALYELNGMRNRFLLAQSRPQIEAINQAMARSIIYGGTADDKDRMLGLAERYSTLTRKTDGILPETSEYVLDAGGTSANLTSIWFVVWSYDNGVYTFYPKGSKAGLQQGAVVEDDTMAVGAGYMPGIKTSFSWASGLVVKDLRQVVRICNIDINTIESGKLINLMIEASERLHNTSTGRPAIYMNRKVRTKLRQDIVSNRQLGAMFDYSTAKPRLEGIEGRKLMTFDEMPIRRVDQIHMNEARVI
ncbi:major capsid protein, partial [Phascolarctobacterium faecium]